MQGFLRALAQIWRLAIPYFRTRELTEIRLWPLPRFRVQERWVAIVLALIVIGIEFGQVAINVRLNTFNGDLFNAIQQKDAATFWSQLLYVFCFWAAIFIASAIIQYVLQSYLQIGWRRWMTQHLQARWLDDHTHYRLQLSSGATDNPDQRIQEDINAFIERTIDLALRVLSAISNLLSFSVILWGLSRAFTVPGTAWQVPGFLVWGALIYSGVATAITHWIGKPLIRLNFEQQRFEADFRFSLARLREYSEQVALLGGEPAERERLGGRFGRVLGNFLAIVSRRKKLIAFTASYQQLNAVVPLILVAPYYFAGQIELGGLTRTVGAFSRVEATMSFFITLYSTLAEYKAIVDRLTTFHGAIAKTRTADSMPGETRRDAIAVSRRPDTDIAVDHLDLALPDGRYVVSAPRLLLKAGENTLLTGPSGSGKSTLFRAIAGIWPYGQGTVIVPSDARLMLMPQRPYIPYGSLREAIVYPATSDRHSDDAIKAALVAAHMPQFAERLNEEMLWSQTLSLGEQQRIAVARALLDRPDWLFMDEATAALDEDTEAEIFSLLERELPRTTIVSIGHRSTLVARHSRQLVMRPSADGAFTPMEASGAAA